MFKYGHLRPGTYDLTSKPYEMNDLLKLINRVKNIILIFLYLQLKE